MSLDDLRDDLEQRMDGQMRVPTAGIMREVVRAECERMPHPTYPSWAWTRWALVLDCGHTMHSSISQTRARCSLCER